MSKLIARPETIAKAINVTEKKIVHGYDLGFRYADTPEQQQATGVLSQIHGDEFSLLEKLKSLQSG